MTVTASHARYQVAGKLLERIVHLLHLRLGFMDRFQEVSEDQIKNQHLYCFFVFVLDCLPLSLIVLCVSHRCMRQSKSLEIKYFIHSIRSNAYVNISGEGDPYPSSDSLRGL